jgi:hypothetical protein
MKAALARSRGLLVSDLPWTRLPQLLLARCLVLRPFCVNMNGKSVLVCNSQAELERKYSGTVGLVERS